MSDRHLYRFQDFELFADENLLLRKGSPVSLTPKMYEMLCVLVRNAGQVVEKETLLKEVWPDSFVEEGNIAFNIRQLRKVLEDDAQSPIFIETVPRRGYRFIAAVDKVLPTEPDVPLESTPDRSDNSAAQNSMPGSADQSRRFPFAAVVAGVIFIAAVIGVGVWYFTSPTPLGNAPILNENFSSEKLSTNGLAFTAAISPDGQRVIYSNKQGYRKNSVWLRELSSASNIEIIPASEGTYFDFVFSSDGSTVYFSRGAEDQRAAIDIYKMPIRGGIPERIITNTEGWISISPDDRKISFVRCPRRDEEYCSLWTADSIGGNEKRLAARPRPIRIADNEISPDGTRIAFASGQSRNQANEFRLMEIPIDGGEEREITSERFFNIRGLTWLPDRSGMLITASRIPNKYFRIWWLSATNGNSQLLTQDPETYSVLSLSKNADRLISTQIKQDFRAYLFDASEPDKKQSLADATSAVFGGNDKIYFSSTQSGNDEIWSMNRDATVQRQLTNDQADDRRPISSPDGRTIYFTSNRSGEAHVWKMAADGSAQTKITEHEGGIPIFVAPDARLVYYQHSISGDLWSVSLENGIEKSILKRELSNHYISADGSKVVFAEKGDGDENVLNIASLPDGRSIQKLKLPVRSSLVIAAWAPDGNSLLYIAFDAADSKNKMYRQVLDGSPPKKLVDMDGEIVTEFYSLSLAADQKTALLVQGGWKHDAVLIKGLK